MDSTTSSPCTDSEEEVFFGTITEKELQIRGSQCQRRRTEQYFFPNSSNALYSTEGSIGSVREVSEDSPSEGIDGSYIEETADFERAAPSPHIEECISDQQTSGLAELDECLHDSLSTDREKPETQKQFLGEEYHGDSNSNSVNREEREFYEEDSSGCKRDNSWNEENAQHHANVSCEEYGYDSVKQSTLFSENSHAADFRNGTTEECEMTERNSFTEDMKEGELHAHYQGPMNTAANQLSSDVDETWHGTSVSDKEQMAIINRELNQTHNVCQDSYRGRLCTLSFSSSSLEHCQSPAAFSLYSASSLSSPSLKSSYSVSSSILEDPILTAHISSRAGLNEIGSDMENLGDNVTLHTVSSVTCFENLSDSVFLPPENVGTEKEEPDNMAAGKYTVKGDTVSCNEPHETLDSESTVSIPSPKVYVEGPEEFKMQKQQIIPESNAESEPVLQQAAENETGNTVPSTESVLIDTDKDTTVESITNKGDSSFSENGKADRDTDAKNEVGGISDREAFNVFVTKEIPSNPSGEVPVVDENTEQIKIIHREYSTVEVYSEIDKQRSQNPSTDLNELNKKDGGETSVIDVNNDQLFDDSLFLDTTSALSEKLQFELNFLSNEERLKQISNLTEVLEPLENSPSAMPYDKSLSVCSLLCDGKEVYAVSERISVSDINLSDRAVILEPIMPGETCKKDVILIESDTAPEDNYKDDSSKDTEDAEFEVQSENDLQYVTTLDIMGNETGSNTTCSYHSCKDTMEEKLNDTVEEMELLLSQGIDYVDLTDEVAVKSEESFLGEAVLPKLVSTHALSSKVLNECNMEPKTAADSEGVCVKPAVPVQKDGPVESLSYPNSESIPEILIDSTACQASQVDTFVTDPVTSHLVNENVSKDVKEDCGYRKSKLKRYENAMFKTPEKTGNKYAGNKITSSKSRFSPSPASKPKPSPQFNPPYSGTRVGIKTPVSVSSAGVSRQHTPSTKPCDFGRIISPVSKYIHELPTPPLIYNVMNKNASPRSKTEKVKPSPAKIKPHEICSSHSVRSGKPPLPKSVKNSVVKKTVTVGKSAKEQSVLVMHDCHSNESSVLQTGRNLQMPAFNSIEPHTSANCDGNKGPDLDSVENYVEQQYIQDENRLLASEEMLHTPQHVLRELQVPVDKGRDHSEKHKFLSHEQQFPAENKGIENESPPRTHDPVLPMSVYQTAEVVSMKPGQEKYKEVALNSQKMKPFFENPSLSTKVVKHKGRMQVSRTGDVATGDSSPSHLRQLYHVTKPAASHSKTPMSNDSSCPVEVSVLESKTAERSNTLTGWKKSLYFNDIQL